MERLRPSDQVHIERNSIVHTTQQESGINSSHSSVNEQISSATTVAISKDELKWVQKIIFLSKSGLIRVTPSVEDDSPSQELAMVEQLANSTVPTNLAIPVRIAFESPSLRHQIQAISGEFFGSLTTGEDSPTPKDPPGQFRTIPRVDWTQDEIPTTEEKIRQTK